MKKEEEIKMLISEISDLQKIQKTNAQLTSAWKSASELLAPKFARMAFLTKDTKCHG